MTVILHSSIDDPEYESAKQLKELFEKDVQLRDNPKNKIVITSSVQCYGQQPQDIDIVIIGILGEYTNKFNTKVYNEDESTKTRDVKLGDFCCVVEVKKHDSEKIDVEGTKLYVRTKGEKKEVTTQSTGQKHSLRKFMRNKIENFIWTSNVIFLPFVNTSELKGLPENMNILFGDSGITNFFEIMLSQRLPIRKMTGGLLYSAGFDDASFDVCRELLTKRLTGTRLDKLKVDAVCKDVIKEQKYGEKIGEQLLVFRGRGGTGKTYRLLNLAYKLYNNSLSRVLILTYNHALISDIKRLFALMGITDGIDESIQIQPLYSFWYSLFYRMEIRTQDDIEKDSGYMLDGIPKSLKEKAKMFIKSQPNQIQKIKEDYPNLLNWDYVMIDEAQDWPADERDMIYTLFSPEKIVIADGYDQLIRTGTACNWATSNLVKDKQIVPLNKSMRQKTNIVRFLKEIANKLNIPNLNIDIQETLHGGRVFILEKEYTKEFHQNLIDYNKEDKNENVDMLFCIPPSLIDKESGNSIIATTFLQWKYNVWDGVDNNIRKGSFPTEVNQLRIVQYDSCRGLEGWITVNLAFDKFYDYKLKSFKDPPGQIELKSSEERRKDFATNWLLIPLTRAIDTLVIQISDENAEISKILRDIAEANPEYITLIRK